MNRKFKYWKQSTRVKKYSLSLSCVFLWLLREPGSRLEINTELRHCSISISCTFFFYLKNSFKENNLNAIFKIIFSYSLKRKKSHIQKASFWNSGYFDWSLWTLLLALTFHLIYTSGGTKTGEPSPQWKIKIIMACLRKLLYPGERAPGLWITAAKTNVHSIASFFQKWISPCVAALKVTF